MGLIERAPESATLRRELHGIAESGRAVVVTGDAGSGKTSLLAAVLDREASDALRPEARHPDALRPRVLRGLCDPLATPRPLGPIGEVLEQLPNDAGANASAPVERRVVDAVAARPTVLVIEDAQWIDAASVEVLRHLVRRIDGLPVLLVLSFRDTEVGVGHPLQSLLGDLARTEHATRLELAPLSPAAVRELLGGRADAERVHEITGGNPFFVSEIARHPGELLPATVRDAVLASATALGSDDLDTLQLIAVAPDGLDDRLLPPLGIDVPALRRLEATGLLVRTRRGVGFRHELARLSIAEAIEPGVEPLLHRRLLDAFELVGSRDAAILTHHAVAAADGPRVLRYATLAAAEATRTGSHTEAVAFLGLALEQLGDDPADTAARTERARLLEELSTEQYMVSLLPEAVRSISSALRLREELGDADGIADAHNRRAIVEYYSARRRAAETHAELAVEAGGGVEASASAQATLAYLAYRRHDLGGARALLAEAPEPRGLGDGSPAALRLSITEAASDLVSGRLASRGLLLLHASTAIERSLDEVGTTAYSNLSAIDIEQRRLREAEAVLAQSIPLTIERDIPICSQWQTGMRARLHLLRGRWTASAEDASTVIDEHGAPLALIWPHLVQALLGLRRGAAETGAAAGVVSGTGTGAVDAHLDAAWRHAVELDESLMTLAVLAGFAERAWHTGSRDPRLDEADERLAAAATLPGTEWAIGELLVWLDRAERGAHPRRVHGVAPPGGPGEPGEPVWTAMDPDRIAEPHRLELEGRHGEAAARWHELGAPYDAAMAAIHGDDPEAAARALIALEALGVDASAARAREVLAARGIRSLPARGRSSTRANPSGLTNRQLDVARLVAQGLTNAELAEQLYISPKTADHHVSAILAKLGLASRRDVMRSAVELGLG
ncbi:helix-turn-helix transcriptional regulator [Agromyces soli]